MSYYYNYTIGYKRDGKLYPLGPYDKFGNLLDVVSRSRSFASDLHRQFCKVQDDAVSDELRAAFEHEDYNGNKYIDVRWSPLSALPSGDYIKRGYFLIDDVQMYEREHDSFGLFGDYLTPVVYAAMAANETRFGKPAERFDCDGESYNPHAASDYMYFAYEDIYSQEYEAAHLRDVANMMTEYVSLPDGAELVVLETEG